MSTYENSPSLPNALAGMIDSRMLDVHVAIPGIVQAYDQTTQTVDVLPAIRQAYCNEDGERVVECMPVISDVPVVFQGGSGFSITFPLVKGDSVLLVFSDSSIDKWLTREGDANKLFTRGGDVDPNDYRKHALSDAIAIPGLRTFNTATDQVDPDKMVIAGDMKLGSKDASDRPMLVSEFNTFLSGNFDVHIHTDPQGGFTGAPTAPGTPAVGATKVEIE